MKVSVVATVLNEEKTIRALLDSLLNQTKTPGEIVIVDGGSKDNTTAVISEYKSKYKQIRLHIEPGSIAHGRNVAVKIAKHKIIAQIDGGCVAHRDWLKKITKPFGDEEVGLVAGFYNMEGQEPFQKALAPYCGVVPQRFDPRCFLPSGRSVAFRKSAWDTVGGYSESLERAGEDTLFNYKVLKENIKIVRVKDAIVDWELPGTFWEGMKKFYWYAKGDAEAMIWWHPAQGLSTHNIKILTIFARYLIALFFFLLATYSMWGLGVFILYLIAYAMWTIRKNEDTVTSDSAKPWVPLVQVGSDVTVMAGFLMGIIGKWDISRTQSKA